MPGGLGPVDVWVFDLDNTLYDVPDALHAEIDRRMAAFVGEFLGVDAAEARRIQKAYFRRFGLTLRGLMVEHGLDPAEFERRMTGLDVSQLRPLAGLPDAVAALEGRKIVFTNAFAGHAAAVLDRLEMRGHFEAVHDIAAMDYRPKPDIASYRGFCALYGVDPARAVMVDDIPHNLEPAAALGMTTVWRRSAAPWARAARPGPFVHHSTDDVADWLAGAARRAALGA